ncbi:Gti1/Pac2 family transcription factor [Nematocida sp. AWRm77]|nr:Gti1/Pac2 family transcription factor [Nematocida sp. AWRm77]
MKHKDLFREESFQEASIPTHNHNSNSTSTSTSTSISRESLFGAIASEEECLRIIDMCRLSVLPRVTSRLTEEERERIRPGSIFVYEEEESGISRWTDGKAWSSSKIHGQCLMYHEIDRALKLANERTESLPELSTLSLQEIIALGKEVIHKEKQGERKKQNVFSGLIKIATSVEYQRKTYHLISYTTKTFMEESLRGTLWKVVSAWEVPHSFHLRMSYRKQRRSFSQVDTGTYTPLPGKKKHREKRTQSCPILSQIMTSSLLPDETEKEDTEHSLPKDFFTEYLYRNDLYPV